VPVTEDDFTYAIENTKVVLPPQSRLETFGSSVLNYYLITEEMDQINLSRVREGVIHADRPQIITPSQISKLLLDGFGENAQNYAKWINENGTRFAFLKYGFCIRKNEITTYEVHDPMEAVVGRIQNMVVEKNNPLSTVLTGVDDAWEVCLLKFMMDYIQKSSGGNIQDFKKRGLL